jgi:hypothetical protein
MLGFVLGTVLGQLAGAAAYIQTKARLGFTELPAAIVAGLTTTVVASSVYLAFHVQEWLGSEPEAPVGYSVFLALCFGICQGVLFRGRPFARRTSEGYVPRVLPVWTCSNCGRVSGEGTDTCSGCGHLRTARRLTSA